jgi:hypothetical protein
LSLRRRKGRANKRRRLSVVMDEKYVVLCQSHEIMFMWALAWKFLGDQLMCQFGDLV